MALPRTVTRDNPVGHPTMKFRDVRAKVLSESKWAYVRKPEGSYEIVTDVPSKISGPWIKSICDKYGVENFTVITRRYLSWHRSYEMGAHMGEWEKSVYVGKTSSGTYRVFYSKVDAPSY